MSTQDNNLNAAEYVIGTLPDSEQKGFEELLNTDAAARREVSSWQRIFGGLNATIAPEIPPQHVWQNIEADISSNPNSQQINDNVITLARSRSRWRMGAIAASLVVVVSGGLFISSLQSQGLKGDSFVAVVNATDGDKSALIVQVDAKSGEVTVRSFGIDKPTGKSLQLWYVPENKKVVSVGLVGESKLNLKGALASHDTLFAISLEPEGGSPTGSRTGPVVYTGKLIRNPENR